MKTWKLSLLVISLLIGILISLIILPCQSRIDRRHKIQAARIRKEGVSIQLPASVRWANMVYAKAYRFLNPVLDNSLKVSECLDIILKYYSGLKDYVAMVRLLIYSHSFLYAQKPFMK
jgi:hypothetical protein